MDVSVDKLDSSDIVIALMGPTGTGKSHFIDILAEHPSTWAGHQLVSHTSEVRSTVLKNYDAGQNLVLVDTPGFDDTTRSDIEILEIIGRWLEKTYRKNIKLAGILYLHRITDNRMGGTPLRNLQIFGELCGDAALSRVTLVTTMWDDLQESTTGETREKELRTDFWRVMVENGSKIARFDNTYDSAKKIVDGLIEDGRAEILLVQEELVDLRRRLNETYAGQLLYGTLQRLLSEQKRSVKKLIAQIEGRTVLDPLILERLRREQRKIEEDLQKTLEGVQQLKVPLSRRILRFLFGKKGNIVALSALASSPSTPANPRVMSYRCRNLLSVISVNTHQASLICRLSGNEAQHVVDFLNMVLHSTDALLCRRWKHVLSLFCRLTKSAQVYPQCYKLDGIQYDTTPATKGGFATVHKGVYKNQTICLKIVKDDAALNLLPKTFIRELAMWAHLTHPNVLPFYGVYTVGQPQKFCLVSPWMTSGNLRDHVNRFPQRPRIPWISDIVDGLVHLHKLDIVHGDLKGQNILISDNERALIADFGVSYIETSTRSNTTSLGATIRWMAPERLDHKAPLEHSHEELSERPTKACDVWSFGCLCYEVLSRKDPFHRYRPDFQVISALLRRELPASRPVPGGGDADLVSNEAWDLIVDCWNHDPEERPTCEVIQIYLGTRLQSEDNRPGELLGTRDKATFWETVLADSKNGPDLECVYTVLQRIEGSVPPAEPA